MKKTIIISLLSAAGIWAAQSIDVNGSEVKSVRIKNQKGGYWFKVCAESTYVDSAGTTNTPGTWKKDLTGYTCIPFVKEGGRKPIQISTLWAKYLGSKADSSLFDIKFRLKSISDDSVGKFSWSSSITMDTSLTVPSHSGTVAKRYFVGGLAFPEADSLCFRIAPATATHNGTCATDSTRGFIGIDLK